MAQLAQVNSACNTKKRRKSFTQKGPKKGKTWIFTLNNPSKEIINNLAQKTLFKFHNVVKYLVQEEVGKCGTPHLQGAVQFKNAIHFGALKKLIPAAHWEPSRSLSASFKYCGKLDTRAGEIFTHGDVDKYIEMKKEEWDEFMTKIVLEHTGRIPFWAVKK